MNETRGHTETGAEKDRGTGTAVGMEKRRESEWKVCDMDKVMYEGS
jgi:hypothetical protein